MQILYFNGFWNKEDCRNNPSHLFIYGDNDDQIGQGGQAQIRNCRNSMGIPTKKHPDNEKTSFYNDKEFLENKDKINQSIFKIIHRISSGSYDTLVLPEDGLGTGLAKLNIKAPKTFEYLNQVLDRLINFLELI